VPQAGKFIVTEQPEPPRFYVTANTAVIRPALVATPW